MKPQTVLGIVSNGVNAAIAEIIYLEA